MGFVVAILLRLRIYRSLRSRGPKIKTLVKRKIYNKILVTNYISQVYRRFIIWETTMLRQPVPKAAGRMLQIQIP
jgi:hypothetical protein